MSELLTAGIALFVVVLCIIVVAMIPIFLTVYKMFTKKRRSCKND